jgi:DNA-binding CsgD family transcriptional regulator
MVEDEQGEQGEFLALVLGGAQHLLESIYGQSTATFTRTPPMVIDWVVLLRGLGEALGTLTPRERQVLEYRYGFRDGGVRTLKETGEIVGGTPERIRLVQERALRKLRHPNQFRKIRVGLSMMLGGFVREFLSEFDQLKERLEEKEREKADASMRFRLERDKGMASIEDAVKRGMSPRVGNALLRNFLSVPIPAHPGLIKDEDLLAMRLMGVLGLAEFRRYFPFDAPPSAYTRLADGEGAQGAVDILKE